MHPIKKRPYWKRHIRQDDLDVVLSEANSQQSKKDIRKRQHFMERSFAYAAHYGFKRARWRGLDKMQIQEYLTAAIQNIKILLKYNHKSLKAMGLKVPLKTSKIRRRIGDILKCINFIKFCFLNLRTWLRSQKWRPKIEFDIGFEQQPVKM